jgi:hypothetical protein
MSTATITGTISYPIVTGGPTSSIYLGSPSIDSSSSAGATISFSEGGTQTVVAPSGSPTTLPMGTVANGSLIYVGSSQPVSLVLNGGSDTIYIAADGFVLLSKCTVTELTVQATSSQAIVTFMVLGD